MRITIHSVDLSSAISRISRTKTSINSWILRLKIPPNGWFTSTRLLTLYFSMNSSRISSKLMSLISNSKTISRHSITTRKTISSQLSRIKSITLEINLDSDYLFFTCILSVLYLVVKLSHCTGWIFENKLLLSFKK